MNRTEQRIARKAVMDARALAKAVKELRAAVNTLAKSATRIELVMVAWRNGKETPQTTRDLGPSRIEEVLDRTRVLIEDVDDLPCRIDDIPAGDE